MAKLKARNNWSKGRQEVELPEQSHILPGGSRLDTTLAVPVEANDSIPDEEGRGREDLRHEEGGEEDCGREKDEENKKHRQHQYRENPSMKITGEDIQLVMDCDQCGPAVTECVLDDCEECGNSWVREDYLLCVIGNDVISLFSSRGSVTNGKIVRGEVERPSIEIEGFNVKLGLKYIAMNEEYTSDLEPLRMLLPVRMINQV